MDAPVEDPNWPQDIRDEFARNQQNGVIGSTLVSESSRVRVWHIRLRPGERMPFHRHALDYFWTAMAKGRSLSHQQDGTTAEHDYEIGETFHGNFAVDEYLYHDLENIGDTDLIFTTVEFLNSANGAIPVPDEVRANSARTAA